MKIKVLKLFSPILFLALLFLGGCSLEKIPPENKFPANPKPIVNQETMTLKIYFGNNNFNPNAIDCSQVYPLERVLPKTDGVAKAALQELFKGPTEIEKFQGYYSWFFDQTKNILKNIKIENETAYVDLSDIRQIIPNASTSCGSAEFLAELETTLKEFTTIKKVVFAIDGEPATFYEWLQLGCPDKNCDANPFK